MTQVHIDIRKPSPSGVDVAFRLGMTWAPTAVRVVDDALVMPESFGVTLPSAPVTIQVAPTSSPTWVWRVRYTVNSEKFDRYLLVPDLPSVEFADLVEIDPVTLLPTSEPEAAWWIALGNVSAPTDQQVADAVEDYLDAHPVTPVSDEHIQDVIAATMVAGTGVTIGYDDTAGTVTVSATGGTGTDPNAVVWRSLVPGDTDALVIWKPSVAEPQDSDGAVDGQLWLRRVSP